MFFVKYNDPIYVKLEKLDIMIRLASQANIAQVSYRSEPHGNSVAVRTLAARVTDALSLSGVGRAEGIRHRGGC